MTRPPIESDSSQPAPGSPSGDTGSRRGDPSLGLGSGREFDLIRRFLAGSPRPDAGEVRVGPGDDCAVLAQGITLSTDMSVEGVHFRRDWLAPREIGYRAAAAALSDLAAMAARPIGVLTSLAVAEGDAGEVAVQVMAGIREAAARAGAAVLGGDLTRSPGPMVIDVAVVGEAREPVLRGGAREGDEVWVTGELGAAGAAVARFLRGERPDAAARERFARPTPRLREAAWLRDRGVPTAMLDLSDGLAGDAEHLAAASGVAILLDRDSIPIHPSVLAQSSSAEEALSYAVAGGEDYELCLCAAPGAGASVAAEFEREMGVRLTRVGVAAAGEGVHWLEPDGSRTPVGVGGYRHFEGGRLIRYLWVGLVTALATFGCGLVAIVASLVGARGTIYFRATQSWARAILWASGTPVVTRGMEGVDWSRPMVLVANHISGYDIFAIAGVLPGPFAFVAKKELERIPFFGRAWKAAGHISIDRSDRQKAIQSLRRAGEKMRRERTTVIIFPEGTRSRGGGLQPFKKGAFVLATQAGVPIVPVVVRGSDQIVLPGSMRVRPRPIELEFCAPIDPAQFGEERVDALMEQVRARMLASLRPEVSPPAVPPA